MSNVVAFQRPKHRPPTEAGRARPPHRFAARAGWWTLGRLCAAPATILEALHPFIVMAYWLGVITGVGMLALSWFLSEPPVRYVRMFQGGVFFVGALIVRHGCEATARGLRSLQKRCDARR